MTSSVTENVTWEREVQPQPAGPMAQSRRERVNVADRERAVSVAGGALLALLGLSRRSLPGLLVAGVGGALIYRGVSGHCLAYGAMGINTAQRGFGMKEYAARGIHVDQAYLINKPPEELYNFWRNFANLPRIMQHLESVETKEANRSHWIATAPGIVGGRVEWDAEIIADEPNRRISWRSLAGADVDNTGTVTFEPSQERGTLVRVVLDYIPPAGKLGKWAAKLFGQEPQQQIQEDLRNFKRWMETGEIPTIQGQPRGTCRGVGQRQRGW